MNPRELLIVRGLSKSFPFQSSVVQTIADRFLHVKHHRHRFTVLENVDFTLYPGECVAIHGPNGSGKSTFLRCLAGVMSPTDGDVVHLGKIVAHLTHGFGAYEELAVGKNILLILQLFGLSEREARKKIPEVAEIAGISERLKSLTSQLSEGMRAKLTLGALMVAPFHVALLDESLNHVDSTFRQNFYLLTRNWISEGRSILLTSHDEGLLKHFATRELMIEQKKLIDLSRSS